MRLSLATPIALLLGAISIQPVLAADTLPSGGDRPFQLARSARAATPGLHIRVVDPAGALSYPIPVAVEYDSGAPVRAQANADGVTIPADGVRNIRAVKLGGQSFDVAGSRANFLVFSR